ncbi:high-affinity choline transporter 1 [Rhipicephalus sanguineus]|uniref:high-affinity choline transporter 1 n=1 Tax=Rhipicephalus sanguineus TaxID=34632 RepID=UPI0020C4CE88|nr:high-affinity choline transporter 1 [Rhipicephalus sanguineus]
MAAHDGSQWHRQTKPVDDAPTVVIDFRKHKDTHKDDDNDYLLRLFLANRSVPVALGVVSMTATWVGGALLNTTAETVFTSGIVWCQAPFGYGLSLMVGGWFFAGKMRVTKALTMLDPFQQHYGKWISVLLTVPAVFSEVFWTASALTALVDVLAVRGDEQGERKDWSSRERLDRLDGA